jgi:hypothetical protein
MSFSFSSLIRFIVVTGLGITMLAIGISRLDPPRPSWRTRHVTRFLHLNEFFMNLSDRSPRWLDVETGEMTSIPLAEGDVLDAASCSPWVDEKEQHQMAGRWSYRTNQGPMSVTTDFGLARLSFPDGRLLDRVSTEIVPVGPPCWFPGTRARILFASGDGQLYHYAFEGELSLKEPDKTADHDAQPVALKWRCPKPGQGKVFLSDLTWPEDHRMSDYVIVALREQSPDSKALRSFTGTTLWWLKLNVAGTEIVDCGKLLIPAAERILDGSLDRRCPTVGALKGGKPVIAYLSENRDERGWDLRVAPLEFEKDHHTPSARESSSLLFSTHCHPIHPSFSSDGRWLNAIADSSEPNGRLLRLSLVNAFSSTK